MKFGTARFGAQQINSNCLRTGLKDILSISRKISRRTQLVQRKQNKTEQI